MDFSSFFTGYMFGVADVARMAPGRAPRSTVPRRQRLLVAVPVLVACIALGLIVWPAGDGATWLRVAVLAAVATGVGQYVVETAWDRRQEREAADQPAAGTKS